MNFKVLWNCLRISLSCVSLNRAVTYLVVWKRIQSSVLPLLARCILFERSSLTKFCALTPTDIHQTSLSIRLNVKWSSLDNDLLMNSWRTSGWFSEYHPNIKNIWESSAVLISSKALIVAFILLCRCVYRYGTIWSFTDTWQICI